MALEPNDEQKSFIGSKNANVLVSASAGSGKTYTMIQKLIHILIDEKEPIQSLLVLTFTEAAASEIKQRLYNEITTLLANKEGHDRELLQNQLDNINDAEIGTLHSVCKKLIVKYFYELDISPDFSLLTEKESKYLLDNAVEEVFESHITSDDSTFFDLYDCYNAKRNDLNLKQMILQLLTYFSNKNNYKDWRETCLNKSFNMDLDENIVCDYLFNISKQEILNHTETFNSLLQVAEFGDYQKYADFLYRRCQFLQEISVTSKFTTFFKCLMNADLGKKPSVNKSAPADELEFDEILGKANTEFLETIRKIKVNLMFKDLADVSNNFVIAKKNVVKLYEITDEIKNKYDELKRNRNVFDFNDLEDKMLELLESEEIRRTLQNKYKYIFFDEYQDINEKQECILSQIVSGDNYYMIGDVKQSIYAFRQSSPKIFIEKFNKYQEDNKTNKVINFNLNYRSDKNILEFNNFIFDTLITKDTIGIDYKENSRFDSINEYKQCNIDWKIIDSKIEESEEETEDIDKERKEAIVVAESIADILTKIKSDGTRFTYRDIAIILRKRGTFLKTLCDVLTGMQIPITTTMSKDFFDSFEINLLLSVLKVVNNYKDDISLSVVLKNLFNVDERELLKIRQSSTEKYFYECVENYSFDDETRDKINSFFEFLEVSRRDLSKYSLLKFMESIVVKFDLRAYLRSMPSGEERENNLDEFLFLLDNDMYKYNADKFIEYVDYVSQDSSLQRIGVSGNAVQICTIHYSKGLEYPAVILAGLGKKFTINRDSSDIIINENFGVGLKSIDNVNRVLQETLIRYACKDDNKKSGLNEEIRLLYVAMTRPKEYLCLIGQYNLEKIAINHHKDIYQSMNFLDMMFKAIDIHDLDHFRKDKSFVLNENTPADTRVEIIKIDEIIDDESSGDNDIAIGAVNDELKNAILSNYQSAPNLSTFTIKNTVTNILREETDYENVNHMPKKLDVTDEVVSKDYLKIGTAYHSVMQYLQFTETKDEIIALIDRLVAEKILPADLKQYIVVDEIFAAKETLKDLILDADQVYKEKQFVMQENYNKLIKNSDNNTKVIIQGIIDLVVVKDGKSMLIDYKTNRTRNEQELINNYSLQLQIYKMAFEKATNLKIDSIFLYSFYLNKLIEIK